MAAALHGASAARLGLPASLCFRAGLSTQPAAGAVSGQQGALVMERLQRLVARARPSRMLQELLEQRAEEEAESAPVVTKLEWQSPLQVLQYPDPRLRAQNVRVGVFDESLRRLAAEMFEVMYQDDGVGLAAPQVGVNVRLMVFNEAGVKGQGTEVILVNPRIVSSSGGSEVFEEGCLSFPSLYADVVRPTRVKVKAQDATGKKISLNLSGFAARIFQHEYDHLQGTLFHDRMAPEVLAIVRPQLLELEDTYLQQHPGADMRRAQ